MTIISKTLTDISGSFEGDYTGSITLEWLVHSNEILDYPLAIAKKGEISPSDPLIQNGQAMGWYPKGTPYRLGNEINENMIAERVEVDNRKIIRGKGDFKIEKSLNITQVNPSDSIVQWRVRQTFASVQQYPITVIVSYEWEDMPFTTDVLTGKPVVNSAGLPFNPPATRRRKIPVYSMTRKEEGNPLAKAIAYSNTVDGVFLIDSIIPQFDGKEWTVTYNLKEKPEGWATYIMDTGLHYKDPVSGNIFPILNTGDGTPISEPARLNGNGQPVPAGSDAVHNRGPFHKYLSSALIDLKLPNPHSIVTVPIQ